MLHKVRNLIARLDRRGGRIGTLLGVVGICFAFWYGERSLALEDIEQADRTTITAEQQKAAEGTGGGLAAGAGGGAVERRQRNANNQTR